MSFVVTVLYHDVENEYSADTLAEAYAICQRELDGICSLHEEVGDQFVTDTKLDLEQTRELLSSSGYAIVWEADLEANSGQTWPESCAIIYHRETPRINYYELVGRETALSRRSSLSSE